MQKTRDKILQFLKQHGEATVDELAEMLGLTPVTVRHHLDVLRSHELVAEPTIRHRSTPGRPQFSYTLTGKAAEQFPKNYCDLAGLLLAEVKERAPEQMGRVVEGLAARVAAAGPEADPAESLPERLDQVVGYLNSRHYLAQWEQRDEGCVLHTCNCPFQALAEANPELCTMDLLLVGQLLGVEPRRLSRIAEGASSCSYLIPVSGLQPWPADRGEAGEPFDSSRVGVIKPDTVLPN